MTTEEKHVRKLTILSEYLREKERPPIYQASPGTESKKIIQANAKTTQVVTLNQDHHAKGKCSWLNTAPSLFHACLIWPIQCCYYWFDFYICKVSQEETALGFRRAGLGLQPTPPPPSHFRQNPWTFNILGFCFVEYLQYSLILLGRLGRKGEVLWNTLKIIK